MLKSHENEEVPHQTNQNGRKRVGDAQKESGEMQTWGKADASVSLVSPGDDRPKI